MQKIFFYILSFMLLTYLSVNGQDVVLSEDLDMLDISSDVWYYEDEQCAIDFNEIEQSDKLIKAGGLINAGVSKSCFWIKIEMENASDVEDYQMILEHPILDVVEFYDPEGNKTVISENTSFYDRTYADPNFIFDLHIAKGTRSTYYLKISGSELIVVPIVIGTTEKLLRVSSLKEMLFGIYAGIILVMFFYNIFVYFTVRDISYLYYVIYILLIGLTQASLKGFTLKYLWPESVLLHQYSVTILSSLVGIAAIEFLKVFLHTKELDLKLHRVSYVLNGLFVVSIILCLSGLMQLSFTMMQLTTMIGSFYALIIAIRILRKGFRPAKFFLIAWSILLIGAVVFVLKDFEVLPFNIYTNYSLQVASILEVVLLSFALADKINIFRKEKEQSQLEALKALEENERIVREQNIILEAKVEERTAALKKANEDLNIALDELKNAQSQLVSAEKMASLGQLTAGIAHEINNPINYVKSSIKPLKDNMAELLELIDEYELNSQKLNDKDGKEKIQAFKEKIQFDYLLEETKDIIENIEEGANRTVEIVSGLRTFSHVDDIGIKETDINKGLTSTLNLIQGEIPPEYELNLDLGEIRKIEAFGGKINQVFMNILTNAIQAIKAKELVKGIINVSTAEVNDHIQVKIEDNGVGMSDEIIEKIFDPFFTTKDVGQGTGLGMSVVYGIIESHNGTIDVLSKEGEGSTIIVNLPYIQPN